MDEVTAFEDVKKILTGYFAVPEADVVPNADLHDLGLDSLDIVELTMEIESFYDVRISNDEFMPWTTVQSVVEYITFNKLRKG